MDGGGVRLSTQTPSAKAIFRALWVTGSDPLMPLPLPCPGWDPLCLQETQ